MLKYYVKKKMNKKEKWSVFYGFDPLSINAIHSSGTTIEFQKHEHPKYKSHEKPKDPQFKCLSEQLRQSMRK